MIWIILAALGVPLWLCAIGIIVILTNNRKLRTRYGDIPVRVRRAGKKRWTRGHALWVSDVFAWRGSPAAWNEELDHVITVSLRAPTADEQRRLRRLGDGVSIATMATFDGPPAEVAVAKEHRTALIGPFQVTVEAA